MDRFHEKKFPKCRKMDPFHEKKFSKLHEMDWFLLGLTLVVALKVGTSPAPSVFLSLRA
jgi:hypothetical protein